MVGVWSLLISSGVLIFVIGSARAVLLSGNQFAFVMALDAVLATLLGIVLNATAAGELRTSDVALFCMFPLTLAIGAWFVARRFPAHRT